VTTLITAAEETRVYVSTVETGRATLLGRETLLKGCHSRRPRGHCSRDNTKFSGERYFWRESLFQKLKSSWELILNKPVPEVVHFVSF